MLINFIYFLWDLNNTSVMFLYGLLFVNPKRLKKQNLDEKVVSVLFCLIFLLCMRVARNFLGQDSFLGILEFNKHPPVAQERKVLQGKNIRFSHLKTLKNCILNGKCYPKMTTVRVFFPKLGHFFPIFEK